MRAATILSAEAGLDADPTRGATNWSGGKNVKKYNEKKFGVDNVVTINEKRFIHSFFNANRGRLDPSGTTSATGEGKGIQDSIFIKDQNKLIIIYGK